MEDFHDFIAVDTRLQKTFVIAHFQVGEFLANGTEIIQKTLFSHLILTCYVRFAENHQIVDVIACIIHQSTYGTVCHHVIGYGDRAHVEVDHLLHILHLGIQRQFEPTEYVRNHALPQIVVIVERPSSNVIPSFAFCLADVMEQRSPSQPQIVAAPTHIVEHFERVIKVVFMGTAVARLNDVERGKFGDDELEQSAALQIHESAAGLRCHHDFIQFICDALAADDFDAFRIALQSLESIIIDEEFELGGKSHAAHHAQRVVAEGDVRVERGTDNAVFHVCQTVERVYEFAKTVGIETYRQGINREITTVLVIFQRAIFHDRFARIVAITFFAGTHKLHFQSLVFDLSGTEISENRDVCPFS